MYFKTICMLIFQPETQRNLFILAFVQQLESLNESLKNDEDEEPTPTAAYHRRHNSYCDKQQWLRYTLFHSHASKGPFSHIYAMRWRNDARFSWCDESTRLSVHTVCDKTVFSTLSDLYVCSQVRNMSYASDNCRDSCFACSNAARCDHIYAMRWRNDARFSWCDESTRLSVHTACDKTVSFFHTIRTVCV